GADGRGAGGGGPGGCAGGAPGAAAAAVQPGGAPSAGAGLPAWATRRGRAEERVAAGRARRGGHALRDAAARGGRGLGRRGGARRSARLRGRAAGRRRRGAHRRRDRLPEEGRHLGRRGAPVQRHGRAAREPAGRGLPGLRRPEGVCLPRPGALPTGGVGGRRGAPPGGGHPRGDGIRHEARAGATDAGTGVRGGRAGGLGAGRHRLRGRRAAALAGGAGAALRPGRPLHPRRLDRRGTGRSPGAGRRPARRCLGAGVGRGGGRRAALVRLGLPGAPLRGRRRLGALAAGAPQHRRPGRARLLSRPRPGGHRAGSDGAGGGVPLADRDGVRGGEGAGGPGRLRGAPLGRLAPPRHPQPAGPRGPRRRPRGRLGRRGGKGGDL
ncbi:MAG: Mobile element protein, partial [uncultured Thermomicrobiales bacterium]